MSVEKRRVVVRRTRAAAATAVGFVAAAGDARMMQTDEYKINTKKFVSISAAFSQQSSNLFRSGNDSKLWSTLWLWLTTGTKGYSFL
jgi:hypothetical protein